MSYCKVCRKTGGCEHLDRQFPYDDQKEVARAAAEISSLRAEVERLKAELHSADDLRKVAEHSAAAKQAVRSVLHGFSALPKISLSGALDHLEEIDAIVAKAVKS